MARLKTQEKFVMFNGGRIAGEAVRNLQTRKISFDFGKKATKEMKSMFRREVRGMVDMPWIQSIAKETVSIQRR